MVPRLFLIIRAMLREDLNHFRDPGALRDIGPERPSARATPSRLRASRFKEEESSRTPRRRSCSGRLPPWRREALSDHQLVQHLRGFGLRNRLRRASSIAMVPRLFLMFSFAPCSARI